MTDESAIEPASEPENQKLGENLSPVGPSEPTESIPFESEPPNSVEAPLYEPQATPSPESATPVKDDISANEPFPAKDEDTSSHGASEPAPVPEVPPTPPKATLDEANEPNPEPIR